MCPKSRKHYISGHHSGISSSDSKAQVLRVDMPHCLSGRQLIKSLCVLRKGPGDWGNATCFPNSGALIIDRPGLNFIPDSSFVYMLFSMTVYIQYYFVLVSGVQHSG